MVGYVVGYRYVARHERLLDDIDLGQLHQFFLFEKRIALARCAGERRRRGERGEGGVGWGRKVEGVGKGRGGGREGGRGRGSENMKGRGGRVGGAA
jgi:hypothetical protein